MYQSTSSLVCLTGGLCVAILALAQSPAPKQGQLGSVNGKALEWQPNRTLAAARFRAETSRPPNGAEDERKIAALLEQDKCEKIKTQIQRAANLAAIQRFGISVSQAEADALHREFLKSDRPSNDLKHQQENSQTIAEGLHQVYDLGMDPVEVYRKAVAPRGILNAAWQMALEFGRTPEGRLFYVRQAAITIDTFRAANSNAEKNLLIDQRLKTAVDDEIARTDETFGKHLQEYRKNRVFVGPFVEQGAFSQETKRYLDTNRAKWWMARYAEVNVVLYDPSLARQCDLPALTR